MLWLGFTQGSPSGPQLAKALAVQVESSAGGTSLICSDARLSFSALLTAWLPSLGKQPVGYLVTVIPELYAAAIWGNIWAIFLWTADYILPLTNNREVGLQTCYKKHDQRDVFEMGIPCAQRKRHVFSMPMPKGRCTVAPTPRSIPWRQELHSATPVSRKKK